ncbi:membrane protein [Mycolicibacterium aromaticivorans JS19b1 = JCM 16368]|uniref:Membrane protein n=1 Tax=Mycolicibacterium aromaticivorans JS19b1 = JCM 16368 TaxID=1440774 RepID=A0A064CJ25_9MYCO|nr:hypothetical protein [Mycolicibacterium aromaticivorans]KDF00296.1 membrane protein [Mycolicibacterium aromaticivorans JS19b1 = JCM 16368]
MDIALGVSMTPTTVRMVLVEGEKADGVTVDHDAFDIQTGDGAATAADQVVAAILGTRESAAEGGHRLVSTGVTWTDYAAAAGLRDALAARKIDDVALVSELHAAGSLAQAVGQTVGYDRTALMFLERDTATVSVVDTATGDIVKVQTEHLHSQDAVAELQRMIAGLEAIAEPPQGVFVLGSGVDVAAVKSQLALGTVLPVHAPDEAELALARGAALASATAPRYDASTVGLAYAQDPDGTTAGKVYPAAGVYPAAASTEMSEAGTQMAAAGYMAPLGYSEVLDEMEGDLGYDSVPYESVPEELDFAPDDSGRKPFLLVGSALTSIFVVGVVALVISLAVSIRPTVDQRPSPAESVIVPSSQPAGPAVEQAAPPAPPSAPSVPDTIQEPIPVVQQAPRTVFVTPAPQAPAPAPAPAAPPPAPEAPAPVPEAPAPAPAPIAPVIPAPILPPPIIVLPQPLLPPFLRPPRQRDYPSYPSSPNYPSYPSSPQTPTYPSSPPAQQPPSQQPQAPVTEAPSDPPPAAGGSGGYGAGGYGGGSGSGGYGGGSGSGSDGGSRSGDSGGSRSGRGSQNPLWPWPSFGH